MGGGKGVVKRKTPKPRNPFMQHLVKRKSGAHVKSAKAQRTREKANLRREAREGAPAPVQS
jgi:hypothetical protein